MASYLCKQNNQKFNFLVLFYGFEWLIPMIYCILDERETLASQITWVCKQIDDLQLFTSKSCWFVYILQGVFIYFLRSENKYFYLVKFSHVITRYVFSLKHVIVSIFKSNLPTSASTYNFTILWNFEFKCVLPKLKC